MSEQKNLMGIMGLKVGMSQLLTNKVSTPVTLIQAGPCTAVQVKSKVKDGYDAVQLGFQSIEERKVSKAEMGRFKKVSAQPMRHLREFRLQDAGSVQVGQTFSVDMFQPGDYVKITGISKGQGFLGVMGKGSAGGPSSHGSMFHRRPGSIGSNTFRSNTLRGRIMPGRVGSETVTIPRVEVVEIDKENNLLVLKGAVPGKSGSLILIHQTGKKKVVRAPKMKVEKKAGQAKTAGRAKT